jgi:putative ABC transport system substrate-binding protein
VRQSRNPTFEIRIAQTAASLLMLALSVISAPLVAAAQQPAKVCRIGYLESGVAAPGAPLFESFRHGLRDLGWIEGQNIAIEVRSAQGKYERLPQLAEELVHLNVDVIVASSTPAALAARHATTTIPIVIGRVADPIGSGLVASLARPGGNITGWTHLGRELRAKYVDLVREAIPGSARIGVLWNPANPIHGPSLKDIEAAAKTLKVQAHAVGVQSPEKLESAFSTLTRKHAEALVVFPDGMFLAQGERIVALAARSRLPAIYGMTELTRAGGLMGYGVNLPDMYRHGASFVDRILKGAKPADLPIEQPTKFELVVNLKTAKALGLTIPQSILVRADDVIQ